MKVAAFRPCCRILGEERVLDSSALEPTPYQLWPAAEEIGGLCPNSYPQANDHVTLSSALSSRKTRPTVQMMLRVPLQGASLTRAIVHISAVYSSTRHPMKKDANRVTSQKRDPSLYRHCNASAKSLIVCTNYTVVNEHPVYSSCVDISRI